MFNKLKIAYLLFFLLPALVSASVSLTGVTYREAESQLIFKFDTQVQYDNVILSRITLQRLIGDINLGDGSEIVSTSNADSLVISLIYSDDDVINLDQKDAMERTIQTNQIFVVVGENAFLDLNNQGNDEVTKSDSLLVNYIPRSEELTLLAANYDAGLNELELTFNKKVLVDLNYVKFQNIDVNGVKLSIVGNEILNTTDSTVIKIKIGKDDQKAIESSNLEGAIASVRGAFRGEKYNPSDNTTVGLNVVPDPDPIIVLSAGYDAEKNELSVDFNQAIQDPVFPDNFFPSGIAISDGGLHDNLVLSIPLFIPEDEGDPEKWVGVKTLNEGTTLVVTVTAVAQEYIETVMATDNLHIFIQGFTVYDELENGNIEASQIPAEFTEDPKPLVFDPENSVYDADANNLWLSFSERLDIKNEVNYLGITLVDPADTTKKFTFESIDEEDLVVNSTRKRIEIDITGDQEAIIESFSALQLILEPFVVFSKDKSPNGNVGVTFEENVIIPFANDTTPPVPEVVRYDSKDGVMILEFDDAVRRSTFDPTGVTFAGVTLDNLGAIIDSVNSNYIRYQVSIPQSVILDQVSDELKVAPKFSLAERLINNFAGLANLEIIDGEDGEEYLVGYGRFFWTLGKESFPLGNELIFGSIRKIGPHSEFYVDDADWRTSVIPDDIDSLYKAFEVQLTHTHPDDSIRTDGIYNMLTNIFGQPTDIDMNGKLTIFLYNVRDDYFNKDADEGGRNNTSRKIYNPGYIEKNDQLPASENPYSNEADILYIDTYPQMVNPPEVEDEDDPRFPTAINALADVFQRIIANNETPNEEAWLVEGLSSISQFLATNQWTAFMDEFVLKNTANNNLTFSVYSYQTRANQANSYLFNLYMYEQYGYKYLSELAAYTRKTGMGRINWILTSFLDPNSTLPEVFRNYGIACLFDKVEYDEADSTQVTDHKFGFINEDLALPAIVGLVPLTFFDENSSAIKNSIAWAYSYLQIAGLDVTGEEEFNTGLANNGMVMINSSNEAILQVVGATQDRNQLETVVPEFNLVSAELDEQNEGQLPMQFSSGDSTLTFRENYKTMILIVLNTGDRDIQVAYSNDYSAPEFAALSVIKSALIDRFLDVYLTSNEALYTDLTEGPTIRYVTAANDTINLDVTKMFEEDGVALNTYLYNAKFNVGTPGTYEIIASARDLSGNQIPVDNGVVSIAKILGSGRTTLTMPDDIVVQVHEKSLPTDSYIYVIKLPERNVVDKPDSYSAGEVYSIMTSKKLSGIYTISIPYQKSRLTFSENEIGLFRLDADSKTWLPVTSQIDMKQNVVTADLSSEGFYQLRKGVAVSEILPGKFALFQNYPNPFNPSTTVRFSVPEQSPVKITVFNLLGQRIITLVDKVYEPGYHTVVWNGTDSRNRLVASGIFFYEFRAGNEVDIKKMVLLK